MSNDRDCCHPIRDTPPPDTQVMTREQVEKFARDFMENHDCEAECEHDWQRFLSYDQAQRETIRQQAREVKRLTDHVKELEQRLAESEKAAYDVNGTIDHLRELLQHYNESDTLP